MTTIKQQPLFDKICLVTGATAGIGKITATALAAQGAELVIHGRNQEKAEITVNQIKTETGNHQVSYLLADFSDLDQVRNLAAEFQEKFDHLHVLVNNAGAFFNKRIPTSTNLLLETLKASTPARIINVSSEAHRQGVINFEDLGFEKCYFGIKAYGRSKLANILFTYELARHLEGTGVTVNALHPGHIATDIWKNDFGSFGTVLKWFMSRIALSPEEGAENSIFLATSPEVEGIHGKYFIKNEPAQSSPASYDEEIAHRLWKLSAELTSLSEN